MKKIIPFGLIAFLPGIAYGAKGDGGLQDIVKTIGDLVNALVPIAVALAVLYFFWGLAQYILKAGDEEGREGARSIMIWGVIALFVIVSLAGIISLLQGSLGIDEDSTIIAPQVKLK